MIIMKQNISSLIAACLIGSAGAASAATTTVNVNFHQPATLDITSQRLTTGLFKTPTPYYDSLDMNLGSGLALSITATAFKNGKTNKPLGDRVVYYSQVGAPGQAGLGVTSVTRWTGPLGTQYVLDNGRDGSIDIDSHASLDNGHDALILSFNQKVTMNSLTLFHMDTDDRATLRVLDGGSSASKNIQRAGPGNLDSRISDSLAQPTVAKRPQNGARHDEKKEAEPLADIQGASSDCCRQRRQDAGRISAAI